MIPYQNNTIIFHIAAIQNFHALLIFICHLYRGRKLFLLTKELLNFTSTPCYRWLFFLVHRMSPYFTSFFLAKVGSGGNTPSTTSLF